MEFQSDSKIYYIVRYLENIRKETGLIILRSGSTFYLDRFFEHFTGEKYSRETIKNFFPGFKNEFIDTGTPVSAGNTLVRIIERMCEGSKVPSVIEFIDCVNKEYYDMIEERYTQKEIMCERPINNLICEFKAPDAPLTINHLDGKKIYVDALDEDDECCVRKVSLEPGDECLNEMHVPDLQLIYILMSLDIDVHVLINSSEELTVEGVFINKDDHKKYFSFVKINTLNTLNYNDVVICRLPKNFITVLENEKPSNQIVYNIKQELKMDNDARIEYRILYIIYALIGHVFSFDYQVFVGRYRIDCVIRLRNSESTSYMYGIEVNEDFHLNYDPDKVIQRKKFLDINNTYLYDLNVLRKTEAGKLYDKIYYYHINKIIQAYESVFCVKDPYKLGQLIEPVMSADKINEKLIDILLHPNEDKIFDRRCTHSVIGQLCGDKSIKDNYRNTRDFITKTFVEDKDYIVMFDSGNNFKKKNLVMTREAFIGSFLSLSNNKIPLSKILVMGFDILCKYLNNVNSMVQTYSPDEIKKIIQAEENIDEKKREARQNMIEEELKQETEINIRKQSNKRSKTSAKKH